MKVIESKTIEQSNGDRIEYLMYENGLYARRVIKPKNGISGEYEIREEERAIEKSAYDQCNAIAIKHTTV